MTFQATLYGKYVLLDRIAVGGMAEVFKAKTFGAAGFERLLVIKRILPHLSKDDEFIEMFIDEAKISVELNHANICQVSDLGKIDDNYFIAMEYIDGKDLRAILKKCATVNTSLKTSHSLYIACEVLKGLDYAHRRTDPLHNRPMGVIHRDISPQNIMLSYHGDIKIVDFGIAKAEFKLNKTQAGTLKGKFGYMSPEQSTGLEMDARSDLFSTGILLYEMLTGRRLFLGENDFETLEKIKECVVPPPSKYNKDVTPELEAVVFKALAKEREDRFETALDFQSALNRILYTSFSDFSVRNLSEFMEGLFAEEILKEQEAFRRAVDSVRKEDMEALRNRSDQSGRMVDPDARPSPVTVSSSGRRRPIGAQQMEATQPAVSRSRPIFLALISIAIAAFMIFGYRFFFSSKPSAPPSTTTLKLVPIRISSIPPGAKISIGGQPFGVTPAEPSLLLSKEVFLRLDLSGYQPFEEPFTIDLNRKEIGPIALRPEAPKFGALRVTSDPSRALISVDGEPTKFRTPYTFEKFLLNEEHDIEVELIGYRADPQHVKMLEPQKELNFKLEKAAVTLRLAISPSGVDRQEQFKVFLDDRERGNEIENLEPNRSYHLRVVAAGYESYEDTIRLSSEAVQTVSVRLSKKEVIRKGIISFNSQPWATVFVDGKEIGETPTNTMNIELPAGKHNVEFRYGYSDPIKMVIDVKPGQNDPILVEKK